ncbi:embryonic protein DC-8-like isoform X2 [Rhododendron vialii]|uniref:embryonic protein DC-8-like isoform X2 n=1 Tax=Rhododendron vialii TaxID=182163 RepID=UPI00265FF4B9|nr:embryonic protein DC-8-like isoform X2 [Rhododendron vialii]
MASTQEKMERAEAAARMAAAELSDVNREQRRQQYGEERGASKTESDRDQPRDDDEKRGVIGNVLKSVAETLEQAVTGRAPVTSDDDLMRREEVGGGNESPPPAEKAKQKAGETKEKAKEKLEETKESAAEKARQAKEKLGEVTGVDRERGGEDQPSHDDDRPPNDHREEERPGILGSLLKVVTGGKRDKASEDRMRGEGSEDLTEKAREAKERAKEKAEETKESAKEKAEETKEKAKEYKDYTAEKAEQTKNSAAEKAKQAKDWTLGKVSEYKDSAAEKAKEAKDTAVEKAREAKEKTAEKAEETKDSTAEKAGGYKDYTAERAKETKDTAVGKVAELKDAAVDKAKRAVEFLTGRREETTGQENKDEFGDADDAEARRKMAALRLQDEDFNDDYDKRKREVVDAYVVLVDVEGTPVGQATATLKTADQATGQTFNDVGCLDDEGKGVVVVEQRLEHPPATATGCPGVVAVERVDPPPEVECRGGVLVVECEEDPRRGRADK